MIALSFFLALAGLAAMGLSQPQHHGWAWHSQPSRTRSTWLRRTGLLLAFAALGPAMRGWGPTFGAVGWAGMLSLAAFALLLARTFLSPSDRRR